MNRERSLKIVEGHTPRRVPPGAAEAGLTAAVAVVLSTFRSDAADMILDHELWFACVQAAGAVVGATTSEVYAQPDRRFLERLRQPRLGPSVGSLDDYGERLLADRSREKIDTDVWGIVLWRNGVGLVAAAGREDWFAVGGPAPYHDSYTTSISVTPAHSGDLVRAIELHAGRAGGWVEAVERLEEMEPGRGKT